MPNRAMWSLSVSGRWLPGPRPPSRSSCSRTLRASIFSTATVSSEQPDFNPANNSATVQTLVNPATADLAVGIAAVPNPVLIGGTLTYTVSLTNNGPSPATSITVTNALPSSAQIQSTTVSRGTASTARQCDPLEPAQPGHGSVGHRHHHGHAHR